MSIQNHRRSHIISNIVESLLSHIPLYLLTPVSYTHLDVYKRQVLRCWFTWSLDRVLLMQSTLYGRQHDTNGVKGEQCYVVGLRTV